jgi:hypothetical protein
MRCVECGGVGCDVGGHTAPRPAINVKRRALERAAMNDCARIELLERVLAKVAAGLIGEDDIQINRAWIEAEVERVLPNWRVLSITNAARHADEEWKQQ